ncbi:MAG TPA: pyridoxal-phosphate dependent enzyme [Thermoanaerobaculia bacterium]|nr:pyridoxal-phosphate dependent enzyme [Thermoanaerobaculia bacterium]
MTPLETARPGLASGRRVFVKREDVHELGAFKWRGALPTLEQYRTRGAKGVVTASTGNHGAATAWAARRTGLCAVVFAPQGASRTKLDVIAGQGAEIRLVGRDLDEAKEEGRAFALERTWPFFEDGDEPAQYGGYGEIALEILQQCPERPGAVVVPVGNGALAAGIGLVLKERSPATALIAVAAAEAPVMARSFEEGRPVVCDRMATFADGLAVRVAIPRAVAALDEVVSRFLLVSEREIARAVGAYASAGIRCEGAAAAALAALPRIKEADPIVVILTGRNIDEPLWRRAVEDPESFPG